MSASPSAAVFLSYASHDAGAARRIGDARPRAGRVFRRAMDAPARQRRREFAEVIAAVDAAGTVSDDVKFVRLGRKCDTLRRLGRTSEAKAVARGMAVLAERLQEGPDFGPSPKAGYLAQAWLRTGRPEDALAAARRFIEALPESNAGTRWTREIALAEILAYLNRRRECCELLVRLLLIPSGLTVPMLRVDPTRRNHRNEPCPPVHPSTTVAQHGFLQSWPPKPSPPFPWRHPGCVANEQNEVQFGGRVPPPRGAKRSRAAHVFRYDAG
jgi:hypothetical protein